MGRSLSGENAANAVLISAFSVEFDSTANTGFNRLFGDQPVHIVAAQITD